MKLLDVIAKAIGDESANKIEARGIAKDAGYGWLDGTEDCTYAGTCWDGNNRADVWAVDTIGGYHISAQAGEMYEEELPEGFTQI